MPGDQVRNSGFGSNYPSSLSDPSITSITPLLISSHQACPAQVQRWRCPLQNWHLPKSIQSCCCKYLARCVYWLLASSISRERIFVSTETQTNFTPVAYTATACMASFITADKSFKIAPFPVKKPNPSHFPASCSPIIRFKSELQQFLTQMWTYPHYCFHHKETGNKVDGWQLANIAYYANAYYV